MELGNERVPRTMHFCARLKARSTPRVRYRQQHVLFSRPESITITVGGESMTYKRDMNIEYVGEPKK
jgi:hypothetical protein